MTKKQRDKSIGLILEAIKNNLKLKKLEWSDPKLTKSVKRGKYEIPENATEKDMEDIDFGVHATLHEQWHEILEQSQKEEMEKQDMINDCFIDMITELSNYVIEDNFDNLEILYDIEKVLEAMKIIWKKCDRKYKSQYKKKMRELQKGR